MRAPKRHESKDGTVSYRVRFRHLGAQSSETFRGPRAERDAKQFSALLSAVGPAGALKWLSEQDEQQEVSDLTLDAWAPRYFNGLTRVTDGTLVGYRRMYSSFWSPRLGSHPLVAIDYEMVAAAVNELSREKSDKTVRNYHGLLSAMLKRAVKARHIPVNPCEDIDLPRRTSHESRPMRLLERDEFQQLYWHVLDHYKPFVALLAGSGMRLSEALALDVGDVSRSHRTVRITKALKADSSKTHKDVGPPKTPESRRTVDLPDQVMDLLEPLLNRPKNERLFLTVRGAHVRQNRFWTDVWNPAVVASGLDPRPEVRDLRHSHASWLIADGMPLPVIQKRLGHKSIQITVDIYGHLSPDLMRASAVAANVALGNLSLAPTAMTALPTASPAVASDG